MPYRIPYQFKNFDNVPVQYIPDSTLEDLIEQDKRIQKMRQLKPFYDSVDVDLELDEVIDLVQERIDMMNECDSAECLYNENKTEDLNEVMEEAESFVDEMDDRVDAAEEALSTGPEHAPTGGVMFNGEEISNFTELSDMLGIEVQTVSHDVFRYVDDMDESEIMEVVNNRIQGNKVSHDLVDLGLKQPDNSETSGSGENSSKSVNKKTAALLALPVMGVGAAALWR